MDFLSKLKNSKIVGLIIAHKIFTIVTALILALAIAVTTVAVSVGSDKKDDKNENGKASKPVLSEIVSEESEPSSSEPSSEVSSEEEVSSEQEPSESSKPSGTTSSKPVSSASKPSSTSSKNNSSVQSTNKKPVNTNYKYNTNSDFNNNVFLDALIYTGYNLKEQLKDNPNWNYILASQKRGMGWLSKIGYSGACSGYETNKKGLPDISRFERGGLVCASYVTYVYFNYLPNVAGIDTSALARPDRSYNADSWYKAAMQWVKKGQAKTLKYTASKNGNYIKFTPKTQIPIGSIMCYQDYNNRNGHCSHVAIYAGFKNNYHWVFHVGNDNGPEFCAVERMSCGPDPQWPLAVISTPTSIRFSARIEIELKDEKGAAMSGVEFSLKNSKTGKSLKLGKTDRNGKLSHDGITYGSYTLVETVPEGYTCDAPSRTVKLTTANNSCNVFKITNTKIPPKEESTDSSTSDESGNSEQEEASSDNQ